MRPTFVAFAFVVLSSSRVPAAGPIGALLDPEKIPRAALLEAKLLADPGATWVERADIDQVLKEQKLQTVFAPQGVGERVKLGKLLKADLLVMVRDVKGAKEPTLEVVVSETAGGLRLLVRAVPVSKSAEEDVAAMLAAVRDGIGKHGEKITEVVAVPPFVGNDLEFTHDYLKGAYAKLAESEALDRKGVVVVELAEAQALAKEVALAAGGAKLDRPLPAYLFGEYRHEGHGKDRTVTLKLRAERGGKPLGKTEALAVKPEDSPAAVRKWSAGVLDALAKDDKPRPPADPKAEAKTLAERARVFRRVGNWSETLALAEASLLLNPDQTDLYADAHTAILPPLGSAYLGAWLRKEADQSVRFASLYVRALAHLEQFVTRGGDIGKHRSIAGGGLFMAFQLAGRDLMSDSSVPAHLKDEILKLREVRREVFLRIIPIVAKDGERREIGLVSTVLSDLPPKERYDLLDRIVAQTEDLLYPRARAVLYASGGGRTPDDTPEFQALLARWSGSKKKHLQDAAAELKAKLEEGRKRSPAPPTGDATQADPNAPGPEAVKFKPVALALDGAAPGARPARPFTGVLALGTAGDLLWSADGLHLMTEKGKVRTVPSPWLWTERPRARGRPGHSRESSRSAPPGICSGRRTACT